MSQPDSKLDPRADVPTEYTGRVTGDLQEPARLGPLERFIGILFSPGETYQDINRKPTFLSPLIIAMVLGFSATLFFNWWVSPDWNRLTRDQIRQQVNKTGGQMPSEEVIASQVKVAETIGKFFPVFAIVGTPIVYLIVAGALALVMMIMQANTTFKKILSVVAWTYCAVGAIGGIVTSASLVMRDRESLSTINPTQPGNITATNLSVILPSDVGAPLKVLAASIDVFNIWIAILLIIGLAAVAGSRKITTKKTAAVVLGLWGLWVLISVASAAAFS